MLTGPPWVWVELQAALLPAPRVATVAYLDAIGRLPTPAESRAFETLIEG